MVLFAAILTLLFTCASTRAEPKPDTREHEVEAFIEEMSAKHGFDRTVLEEAFRTTRARPQILELMERSVAPRPWEDYRALFVTPEKIAGGARFWRDHAAALKLARERYGVPEEIVTAVIGIETHYGAHTGRYKVLEALSTLAFDYPRRAAEFRVELEHFLLLTREESLPLASPLGSYAGAMGIAQFMPGSYRRYAIDFDGDGKRDLFDDAADAIGSVANYLTAHGWQRDGPVATPVRVMGTGAETFRSAKLDTRHRLEELEAMGVTTTGGSDYAESERAIPLTLNQRRGQEYWLGFDNFYVITRYNQSVYYAMAVYQLSQEIRSRYELQTAAGAP
jgi:peptidoglycan lytic transglycosylase B